MTSSKTLTSRSPSITKDDKKKMEYPRIIFVAIALGIFGWVLEALADVYILHGDSLIQSIFYPEHHTLFHRIIIVFILILFSGHAQAIYNRQKKAKNEIQHSYELQATLNDLLKLHLENISLDEMLERIINQITSIQWLTVESKGLVMLISDEPETLEIRAHKNLSTETLKICTRLPFGKCICGRVAKTRKPIFTNCLNDLHDVRYKGIVPHGHYCTPILSQDEKILGVLNLYLKEGHKRNKKEEEFIDAIANVVAVIIERKQALDNLEIAYKELKETEAQLIQSEKLAGMGTMAAGIAHEIKNPIQIIMGMTEIISDEDNLENIKEDTKDILQATDRMNEIIENLTTYSRDAKTLKPRNLDFQQYPIDVRIIVE